MLEIISYYPEGFQTNILICASALLKIYLITSGNEVKDKINITWLSPYVNLFDHLVMLF